MAEVGARLKQLMPGGEHRTQGTEGLVMRVRGDGQAYLCILETEDGNRCVCVCAWGKGRGGHRWAGAVAGLGWARG